MAGKSAVRCSIMVREILRPLSTAFVSRSKAGLNVALCGISWWTTDIGGFINGDPEDEEFRELIVRWFEFGVFCPVFRLHGFRLPYPERDILNPDGYCGSGAPNEVWSFGETAYQIITKYMFLREKMIPYIMEQMEYASQTGTPVIRPLFLISQRTRICMKSGMNTCLTRYFGSPGSRKRLRKKRKYIFQRELHGSMAGQRRPIRAEK